MGCCDVFRLLRPVSWLLALVLALAAGAPSLSTAGAEARSPITACSYDAVVPAATAAADPLIGVHCGYDTSRNVSRARTCVGARRSATKGRSGADNIANGPRLADDLTRREAAAVFDDAGRLHPDAITNSQLIIPGSKLNPGLIRDLTRDGSKIADWGKYTTQRFKSPSGPFEVHFYRNRATGRVNYDFDYKAKLGGRAP